MVPVKQAADSAATREGSPTSLATLSKHLNLSMAAISRVLNGSPAARSIPQATQARIFAAAKELNYRPNLLARSLRRGRSTSVGVLVPEISEGYASLVLAGLEETLSAAGYVLVMITHHHRAEVLARSQEIFAERAVDAVVAVDTALPPYGPIPTVTVSCPDPHPYVTNIVLNHERVAELALAHLKELGHTRVAIMKGQPFTSDTEARWNAIQLVAKRVGLELPPSLVVQMEEDLPNDLPGYRAAERLLATESPFSALFAFNDISAIGAIRALRHAGRSVPHDVSVVGIDDVSMAALHHPALTTVRQPLHKMGALAAQAILAKLHPEADGEAQGSSSVLVEPELIIRDTTEHFPAAK